MFDAALRGVSPIIPQLPENLKNLAAQHKALRSRVEKDLQRGDDVLLCLGKGPL